MEARIIGGADQKVSIDRQRLAMLPQILQRFAAAQRSARRARLQGARVIRRRQRIRVLAQTKQRRGELQVDLDLQTGIRSLLQRAAQHRLCIGGPPLVGHHRTQRQPGMDQPRHLAQHGAELRFSFGQPARVMKQLSQFEKRFRPAVLQLQRLTNRGFGFRGAPQTRQGAAKIQRQRRIIRRKFAALRQQRCRFRQASLMQANSPHGAQHVAMPGQSKPCQRCDGLLGAVHIASR